MRDFRNLDVWHKSHEFTLRVHRVTETFPRAEMLGLAGNLRRRCSAMTMKIAEGCGKDDQAAFGECLAYARELEWRSNTNCCWLAIFNPRSSCV